MRSRIDLQWPIYTGGRLSALTRAAGAEAEAVGHDRDAARADLKLEITRSFWAVITARARIRMSCGRPSTERARTSNDVRNQLSVGLVPPSDVLTIEAQHAHQRMLSIEADNIVETTSAEFRRLTGSGSGDAVRARCESGRRSHGRPAYGARQNVPSTAAVGTRRSVGRVIVPQARYRCGSQIGAGQSARAEVASISNHRGRPSA